MKLTKVLISVAAIGLVAACSGGDKAPAPKKAAAPEAKAEAPKAEAPKAEAPKAAEPAGEPGTIKVTVRFQGDAPARTKLNRAADAYCAKTEALSEDVIVNSNGTLANTAVYIKKVRGKFEAPKAPLKLHQDACTYSPRVQTAMKGQTVEITNGDKTLHNVHSYKGTKKKNWFNVAQPPGAPAKVAKLKKAEISTFKCDVHPWMASYVITTDHPFNGVTSEDGTVTLTNVPSKAKPYKIITWHEKYGEQTAEVIVKPGQTTEVSFAYRGS